MISPGDLRKDIRRLMTHAITTQPVEENAARSPVIVIGNAFIGSQIIQEQIINDDWKTEALNIICKACESGGVRIVIGDFLQNQGSKRLTDLTDQELLQCVRKVRELLKEVVDIA